MASKRKEASWETGLLIATELAKGLNQKEVMKSLNLTSHFYYKILGETMAVYRASTTEQLVAILIRDGIIK